MKKGPLHFLGRKNNSLFDTNVKMKDMDNVELVLGSSAIPESGTASVRARPTVKHHTSSYDSFQGFAVPTPKVPLLPPVNGPKINGSGEHPTPSNMYSVGGDHLTNGSVPDLTEDIFVPPHPSMAPPLPPGTFLPPPDFMGDLNTLDQSTLQPPSMPAPKPPSLAPSLQEEDFTFLKPPPMAPPKPPSTSSSSSMSSIPISNPPSSIVPDHPRFAPPQPPTERQPKTKMPPPKPIRLSSMSNLDSPPQTPAPPPPVQTPTLSTFNPQNTAKLYHIPTTSILKGYEEPDTRPKQKLLLEDSLSIKTSPLLDGADDKVPKVATPSNPVLKDAQELKDNLQTTPTPQKSLPGPNKEPMTTRVSTPPIEKPLRYSHQTSPSPPKVNGTSVNSEPIMDKPEMSPSPSHKFSPLLDRKLRNLKSNETHGAKEGAAASPLALLMAAKKREKQRTTHSLSRENSAKKDEQPSSNIPPSDSSPNSFVITPRSSSSSSLASQEKVPESPKPAGPGNHTQTVQIPEKLSNSPVFKSETPSSSPNLSQIYGSPSLTNLVAPTQNKVKSPSKPQASIDEVDKVDINLPVLPPPPEFDDLDDIIGPPPAITPPDPPRKTAPAPAFNPPPPPPPAPTLTPAPPPKPKPPQAPKLPPPDTAVKPKLQAQTKPKVGPNHIPSNLSPSQVTLLSILQKKMAEMDHKMNPMKETEANSDDWGNPLSDEENKVPIVPKVTPPSKNNIVVNKTAGLDIRELEGKVVRKHQDTSSVRSPTSNGVQSKHQYGMTFTVRPGTKNPITPWSSAES